MLYIFSFFTVVFSLEIICNLINNKVENCSELESTLRRCLRDISYGLSSIDSNSRLVQTVIVHLKKDISTLIWSYLIPDRDAVKFEAEIIVKYTSEVFLNELLPVADRILAVKLMIIVRVLENLTKPEDAVLDCLQWLQKLHDKYFLTFKKTGMTFLKRNILFKVRKSIITMNKILFQFVRVYFKPPPTVEEWPATILFRGKVYNPLIDLKLSKKRLNDAGRAVSSRVSFDICEVGSEVKHPVAGVEDYSAPIIEALDNRYIQHIIPRCSLFSFCMGLVREIILT